MITDKLDKRFTNVDHRNEKRAHREDNRKLILINFGNIDKRGRSCRNLKKTYFLLLLESLTQKTATMYDNSLVKITSGLQQFFNFVTHLFTVTFNGFFEVDTNKGYSCYNCKTWRHSITMGEQALYLE